MKPQKRRKHIEAAVDYRVIGGLVPLDTAHNGLVTQAPSHRRGFTLLEVMTVVAIIAILVTLLVAGASKVVNSSKVHSTKITLQVLQGMLAEFDVKTHLSTAPQAWAWVDPSNGTMLGAATNASGDFWRVPFTGPTPQTKYDAMYAPPLVSEEGVVRNLSPQVLNTTVVMGMLLGLPSNRSALEKLSPDRFFVPTWTDVSSDLNRILFPGSDLSMETNNESLQKAAYFAGDVVQYTVGGNTQRYRALAVNGNLAAASSATPSPTSASPWAPLTTSTPMLLDAWGNPIIFVPGTGLRVRLLNGAKDYNRGDGSVYDSTNVRIAVIVSPEGQVTTTTASGVASDYVIKPGRPFWASAGPDGDFTKGDDNIYSFEQ